MDRLTVKYLPLLKEIPLAIQIFQEDGLLVYANPAWEKMWNAPAESVVGKYNVFEVDLFDAVGLKEMILQVKEGKAVQFPDFAFDPEAVGLPGRKRWIRARAFGVKEDSSKVTHMIVMNEDITDVVEYQNELQQTINELNQTQKLLILQERLGAVGQLSAGIAHDFNNMLATILLEAQLLQKQASLDAKQDKRIEIIVEQIKKGADLIEQILDFSRKSIIQTQSINLNKWLLEFVELIRRTVPKSIEIESDFPEAEHFINADPTSLQQLFMNLVINARDAIEVKGKITLTYEIASTLPNKFAHLDRQAITEKYALIKVMDNGIGIPDEFVDRVYEPFFTTKEVGKGTGLGLAQAYGIVKRHYGFIDYHSSKQKGTTFLIYFPLVNDAAAIPESDEAVIQVLGNQELLLLVEDNLHTQASVKETLLTLNYNVLTADNGEDALNILKSNQDVEMIISDVVMPKMGGFQLQKAVESMYPDIKFLLMSGYAMGYEGVEIEDDAINALLHANEWIQKPFTVDEIANHIQKLLNQ